MTADHKETAFEHAIEQCLLSNGYEQGDPRSFDAETAIDGLQFLWFVRDTQPVIWQSLEDLHGPDAPNVLLNDLVNALDGSTGSLAVLRHGLN